jgi:hypothetical protein
MKAIVVITFIVLVASAGCRKPKRFRHRRWTPPSEFGLGAAGMTGFMHLRPLVDCS